MMGLKGKTPVTFHTIGHALQQLLLQIKVNWQGKRFLIHCDDSKTLAGVYKTITIKVLDLLCAVSTRKITLLTYPHYCNIN